MALIVVFIASFDSPLVSWMRRFGLAWIATLPFAMVAAHHVVRPQAWVARVEPLAGFAGWGVVATPLRSLYLLILTAVLILGTAPAVDAWRRARSPLARRQAGILAITFALTNVSWVLFILWYLAYGTGILTPSIVVVNFLWQAGNSLGLAVGLVYGIVKTQLFDIDLRIKWTVRRGTVAGAFIAVFLIAVQIAQSYLQGYGVVAGGAAAGALLFALRPIERAADRLADRAMPRVQDAKEYRLVRKREVYRAAVESAFVDGSLSDKDRGVLAALAQQLALGAKDAHDIERDARPAGAGVAA